MHKFLQSAVIAVLILVSLSGCGKTEQDNLSSNR